MEQRSSNDIKRNAMVTIFLRMLERFDGILFLTTNRGDNLDIAIKSRLSIILDYKPFTKEERQLVWKNIINHQSKTIQFELSEDDLEQLSTKPLNGREIKHLVKMSIALSENNKITLEDVNSVLKYIHTE
jgi:AAA+ superfamily predicted ATPase